MNPVFQIGEVVRYHTDGPRPARLAVVVDKTPDDTNRETIQIGFVSDDPSQTIGGAFVRKTALERWQTVVDGSHVSQLAMLLREITARGTEAKKQLADMHAQYDGATVVSGTAREVAKRQIELLLDEHYVCQDVWDAVAEIMEPLGVHISNTRAYTVTLTVELGRDVGDDPTHGDVASHIYGMDQSDLVDAITDVSE